MYRRDLDPDPIAQFSVWLDDARESGAIDATSMALATAGANGHPSARIVLLKHFDAEGFCWYTDSRSQKGQQLAENPNAALLFHWRDLNRQVRIVGTVDALPHEAADEYFYSRPVGSRFSAAASEQTTEIQDRATLEQRVAELHATYPTDDVPRPSAWIGYRLRPIEFEFWQGKVNRLHDRIVYLSSDGAWSMIRRSP
ncbi:MAG: pyridoxamine 5'-phosphate oxidase [Pseudomonadota bacterium]